MMNWYKAARYCSEIYGVEASFEKDDRFFICPECGEPLLACDWEDHDFDTCPVCEFSFL